MEIFFTSDLHLGHENVIRYDKRPFASVEEMNNTIIQKWNQRVRREDTVYVLGDVSWYGVQKTAELVSCLNGHKILVSGNHDRITPRTACGFESVCDYREISLPENNHAVLCHYPIPFFNRHRYGTYMLYGHVHNSREWQFVKSFQAELQHHGIKCNMCNVGCMVWDYQPVTFAEIKDRINAWGRA